MIYGGKKIWTLTLFLALIIRSVNVQFAMPMPMPFLGPIFPPPPPPQPIFPMQASMPCMFPIQIAPGGSGETGNDRTTTTTTTTSKPDVALALAMPIPMPVPIPMPALPAMPAMPILPRMPAFPPPAYCQGPPPRPKTCPPCPPCTCQPSCTPSFFSYCSPCHLKCRCKRVEDAPHPIPIKESVAGPTYAMGHIIAPPPVVLVPFPPMPPPRRRPKKKKVKYSSCSQESTDYSSSSDSDYFKKGKRKILNFLRRDPRSSETENELVKPMLSYISENGDIKYETKISNDDVAELLREGDSNFDNAKYQTVQVLTNEDKNNKPKVSSKDGQKGKRGRTKYKRVFLRGGISNHVLDDGKKQLIFRPADNKKISNLSVSFQIA